LAIELVQTGVENMKGLSMLSLILACVTAPRSGASDVKPSLEVQVLGSGGPRAFGRAGSSYIVLVDGTPRILLDAGPGAFVRIGELNIDLQQVDIVLLTHLHIDHSGDLAAFFNARADQRWTNKISGVWPRCGWAAPQDVAICRFGGWK